MLATENVLLNKIIYSSVIVPLLLCGLLMWFLIYYQKKRHQSELREKELIIQKQTALQAERTRIAAEMHDDLGGGLTTIKFLGQKMLRKISDVEHKTQLTKIVDNSQHLVSNMSEIIWAMNAGFDSLGSLVAYARRYASEYLSNHDLRLSFNYERQENRIEISGEKRRHIYLIIKEILHNIVKHADATIVSSSWNIEEDQLLITVSDNGIGIDHSEEEGVLTGNGLQNMQDRISLLDGQIKWQTNNGTTVTLTIPLTTLDKPISTTQDL